MKALFKNKLLLVIVCLLLFGKGISFFVGMRFGMHPFFYSTSSFSYIMLIIAALSESKILFFITLLFCLAYWVFFVLLCINRKSAGFASVGILLFCLLDLPFTLSAFSFVQEFLYFTLSIVFNLTIVIMLLILRRSRTGVPTEISKVPDVILM